ncbi:uncharacterized protein PV09_01999 [Verruconis gallopava]|uniref:Uncharacterized protein n=1 Tax=Verruconis gallopava TaxID=253628 RepID=A0A0D1XWI2_9PEZI|nr:uncharacterized protein PV09_01999 [Verruconis gallopava]KIW07126.1 hypothetical protein PV09_01999 [Verruconis gallopava]
MSDSNRNDRDREQRRQEQDDPFTRSIRHFDNHVSSLFNTLWTLPTSIYQRGNDHGRAFNRFLEERRREREEEQEREDGRGERACRWGDHRSWKHHGRGGVEKQNAEPSDAKNDAEDVDQDFEWINQVAKALERNEREAQNLYNAQKRMMDDGLHHRTSEGSDKDVGKRQDTTEETLWPRSSPRFPTFEELEDVVRGFEQNTARRLWEWESRIRKDFEEHVPPAERSEEKQSAKPSTWSDLFPAWSRQPPTASKKEEKTSQEEESKLPELRIGSVSVTQKQAEEAFERMHREMREMMAGASQLSKMFQDSYNRESRIFDEEGLFGHSFPFNKPLSTMFSLGMRPFLPQDSAMAYLLFSEYSPLHLEHEEGFDKSFRKRFEDLVALNSGKEMRDKNEEEGTQVDFLARIVPLLNNERSVTNKTRISSDKDGRVTSVVEIDSEGPTSYPAAGEGRSGQDTCNDASTEQELHERHFSFESRGGTCFRPGQQTSTCNEDDYAKNKSLRHSSPSASSILSTLTTTERHIDADGNITTKTVLKKRFADGREETETSTHRESSPMAWVKQRQLEAPSTSSQQEEKTAKEGKSGRGWFWSS